MLVKRSLLFWLIVATLSACSTNVKTVETKKDKELRMIDKKYDEALGWLVSTRYREESDFVSSMEIANGFCKAKGKMATLYESEYGAEITEKWACQTPPKLSDSDVLRAVYCHFIAITPKYSVDISNRQKQRAEEIYNIMLIRKGIEYPVGGIYEKYQYAFIKWVLHKDEASNQSDLVLKWFIKNCK